jgi:glycosyltransferase domain-containing protein
MFTIIIPTHERHAVLLRSIDYYQNFNCNVIIADSSMERLDSVFPDNVKYRHLPKLSFIKKVLEVAENVTTPYLCMSADDDYIIESSLQAATSFLSDNPDFVSAQGRYLRLELIEDQVIFSPRYSKESANYAVTDEDILSRVINAYNPYMHHFYSVHRTEVFVRAFRSCVDISIGFMVEVATILVPMCYGKHKVLPMLWMVRDSYVFPRPNVYKNFSPEKSNRSLVFQFFRNSKHYVNEFQSYLASEEAQLLRKQFARNISDLVDNEESDKIFHAAFKSFLTGVVGNRNKVILKNIIKSIIPDGFLNYYMKTKTAKHVKEVSRDKEALEKIRLSVLSFAKCYEEYK